MDKKKEKQKQLISSVVQNSNHQKDASDGKLTFEMSMQLSDEYYPVGPSARFIYDLGNGYFTYYDESVFNITGFLSNEIVFADPVAFILNLVIDEHLVVTGELTQESFELCRDFRDYEKLTVNLEYNIKTKSGTSKRILSQFTPVFFESDGYPKINAGRMVDITHMKKDGAPLLYVLADNQLLFSKQGNPNEMIKSGNIIFSNKEIEVLRLISEGYMIKEVATMLHCSIATIYTHRKNIRLKSQTDINKVITNLKERGII